MSKAKKRVRVMPAIREESNLRTTRIPVHIIPPGAGVAGTPLPGSMIIQNLPDAPRTPPPKVTPSQRHHDNVEQVVADYLHFSRYGKVLPVSHGFAPLACPCCTERNRQNLHHMKERSRRPAPDPDPEQLPAPISAPDTGPATRRPEGPPELPTASPQRTAGEVATYPGPFPTSWMTYQPMPYAQTVLNPEFNRASMLESYERDRKQYEDASMAYVSGRVLDASTKYDLAMKKLERSLDNFSLSQEEPGLYGP